jgi:hypothetical protein
LLEGHELLAATGTWTGTAPITYGYQWEACSVLTKACSKLVGQTEKTLTLGLAELGKLIGVEVIAKNVAGSSSATSSLTGEVRELL